MDWILIRISINAIILAVIFGIYICISGLINVEDDNLGLYIYFVIYICSAIGGLSVSTISRYITGIKWSVIIGSVGFVAWYVSLYYDILWIVIICSVIMGLLLSVFMSQILVWLASMPIYHDSTYYVGIFNFVFGISGVIGSVIAIIVFNLNYNFTNLLMLCGITSIVMSLILIFSLDYIKQDDTHAVGFYMYSEVLKLRSLWLIHPIVIYNAACLIFTFAIIPKLFANNYLYVSYHYLVYSCMYSIWCYVIQYIYRRYYTRYILFINLLCIIIEYVYLVSIGYINLSDNWYFYSLYSLSIISAINDSTAKTLCTIESNIYFHEYKAIFGISRAIYSVSAAIFSIIAIYTSWYYYSMILVFMLAVTIVSYVWLKTTDDKFVEHDKELLPLVDYDK